MSRTTKVLALAILCLAGTLLPRIAAAETVSFGTMSTVSGVSSLDLTGTFAYALDVGGTGGQIFPGYNNLTFTDAQSTAGVTYILGPTEMGGPTNPNFGADADNNSLESILTIGHWGNAFGPFTPTPPNPAQYEGSITMAVTPTSTYKLQIMYWEWYNARAQDLYINGALAVDELAFTLGTGRVFTYQFTSAGPTLNIRFAPGTTADPWTHIEGMTLELVPEPSSLTLLFVGMMGLVRIVRRR